MKNQDCFWIFSHTGLGDHIVCTALYHHFSKLHSDKVVIIVCWPHNMAALQWLLSDCKNVYFYPVETEQQLLTCRDNIGVSSKLLLGFYEITGHPRFNPVLWDSEFYRQAGLDPELSYSGFLLPDFKVAPIVFVSTVCHHDPERGFGFREIPEGSHFIDKSLSLKESCRYLYYADTIHCIDSSMLCLADRIDTPYCKRFVFHRYARRGLPPALRKAWEILD